MEDLCERTKQLWNIYFMADEGYNLQTIQDILDPNCIIIGTGKHEFYRNLTDFIQAVRQEMAERENIRFQFKDFWCQQQTIGPDTCLVYGGLYIWWESSDKKITIDMDSRFSMLYQKKGDGWKVVHIHQSLPNLEQMDGEYYPKTLSQQVIQSQEKIDKLKTLAETDSMTSLINFRTFQEYYQTWDKRSSWLFILDIDKFKEVNDRFGHVAGNQVLQKIASALVATVRSSDLVCRMGGDEFLILCRGFNQEEKAREFILRLKKQVEETGKEEAVWANISVGGTKLHEGQSLESALSQADEALYADKGTETDAR